MAGSSKQQSPGKHQISSSKFVLCDGVIDFVWLPKEAAFHAACNDECLTGDVAGEGVGREKDGGVGDVIGSGDLRKGHGGSDFFDHRGIAEFGFISRDNGPARANAIEPSTAVIACVRSEAGDFVFQRAGEAVGDGGFPGRIIRVTGFAEDPCSRGNENGVAVFLFCDDAEVFAEGQKHRGQDAIDSLLPVAERHSVDGNVGSDPGTCVGDESVDATETLDCLCEHAFDLSFFSEVSLNDERIGMIEFATERSDLGAAAAVVEGEFRAFGGKLPAHGGADAA
jgi:hypothetical protein